MFSKLIRIKLVEKGLKNKDLAKALGKTPATISDAINADNFKESRMREIADALDCDLVIELRSRSKS